MRKRDATTPLVLWICAAICVHFVFGGGAAEVATVHDDEVYLHRMASEVRDRVRQEEQTFDVSLLDSTKKADAPAEPPPPPPPAPKPKPPEVKKPPPPPVMAKNEKKLPEPKKEEETAVLVKDGQGQAPPASAAGARPPHRGEAARTEEPGGQPERQVHRRRSEPRRPRDGSHADVARSRRPEPNAGGESLGAAGGDGR